MASDRRSKSRQEDTMDDPQDLVSVFRAPSPTEAHLLMNLLTDEEIDARVAEENEPFAGLPVVPAEVLVRKADEARARAIVAEYEREQEERAERPDWTCAKCGATVVGAFDECDACGADRPGTSAE
jgi:ribosomal protein L12E/L44/L45/RPP1/RPP2